MTASDYKIIGCTECGEGIPSEHTPMLASALQAVTSGPFNKTPSTESISLPSAHKGHGKNTGFEIG